MECSRCLLNTSDTLFISFNEKGECNYCQFYDSKVHDISKSGSKNELLELFEFHVWQEFPYECKG